MNINPAGRIGAMNSNTSATFGNKGKKECSPDCQQKSNSMITVPRVVYAALLAAAMGGPITSCKPEYITPEHIVANYEEKPNVASDSTYTVIPEDSIYDEQDSIVSPPKIDSTANESRHIFKIVPPPASNPKVKDVPPVYVDSIPNKKGPVAPSTEEDSTATESRHIFKICPPPSGNQKTKDVPPVNPTPSKKK